MHRFLTKFAFLLFATAPFLAVFGCSAESPPDGEITDGYTELLEQELDGRFFARGWQLPAPANLVAGTAQYGLELYHAADRRAVDDAIVTVYASSIDHEGEDLKSVALPTLTNPEFYEARLDLERTGEWEIEYRIGEPVNSSIFTTVEVMERNRTGDILWQGTIAFVILFLIMIGAAVLVLMRGNRRKRRWQTQKNGD